MLRGKSNDARTGNFITEEKVFYSSNFRIKSEHGKHLFQIYDLKNLLSHALHVYVAHSKILIPSAYSDGSLVALFFKFTARRRVSGERMSRIQPCALSFTSSPRARARERERERECKEKM